MKISVFRRMDGLLSLTSAIVVLLILSGCAHSISETGPDLIAADKECSPKAFTNLVALVDCQDSKEMSVIKKDAPVVLLDFKILSTKRRLLAQNFDDESAPAREAWNRFKQGDDEGAEILSAHEPRWKDKDAILNKDIVSADLTTCTSDSLLNRMKCHDSITRIIWMRDAPDTMEYYSTFQKNRFKFAKQYDDSSAPKTLAIAKEHFQKGMKEISSEFISDARQTIQQQQSETDAESVSLADVLKAIVTAGVGFGQSYAMGHGSSSNNDQSQQQTLIQQQELDLQRQQQQQQQYQASQQQLLQNQENMDCHIRRIGNPNAPCP